jgi:hypothetical protein
MQAQKSAIRTKPQAQFFEQMEHQNDVEFKKLFEVAKQASLARNDQNPK